jgi:kynurenine formamidase
MTNWKLGTVAVLILIVGLLLLFSDRSAPRASLWDVYYESLKGAKYVDLTHTINPSVPVWYGFGPSKFAPTADPATNRPYSYEKDGFEATHYDLATDQLGTQLDPPAHWNPYFPAIDELPATYTIRPLVVIPIQDKAAKDPGYQMTVDDIRAWEQPNAMRRFQVTLR